MSADDRFRQAAAKLGHDFGGDIKSGGNYVPLVRHGDQIFLSGQVPRVGDRVVVIGRVGETVDLDRARHSAAVCAMRALVLLQRYLGSLDKVRQVLRMTVYVQSATDFTQQSEVADGASEILFSVLGEAGAHTRSAVGVLQLPKGATTEIDLIVAI